MDTVECRVDKVVFRSAENGFSILSCITDHDYITITGPMADVQPGVTLTVQGEWKTHPKYGRQMEADHWICKAPQDLDGIELYLTNFCKGIGRKYAHKIVQAFGPNTIETLDKHPEKLSIIRGIGKGRLKKIQESWKKHKTIQDVMIFLQGHGVTPGYAARIYAHYEEDSIAVITKNPYQLADEVQGIGFQMADQLARSLGIDKDSYVRIRSGVLFTLNQVSNDGHVYARRDQLVHKAIQLLDVDEVKLQATIDEMMKMGEVVKEGAAAIYLPQLRYCEIGIANNLDRLMTKPKVLKAEVAKIETKLKISYDPLQADAIMSAMNSQVMVLTGGPGTRVILIGDIDQLPSVGAGNVLRDIIDSEMVPTVRLSKIFRQALTSKIIENCHRVNEGQMPDIRVKKDSDFFFIRAENKDDIPRLIEELVSKRLPNTYEVDPLDIQVLCPQKTSDIGTVALNKRLQAALNDSKIFVQYGDTMFKIGDKVMQMQNNYDKNVFNGDVGNILSINREDDEIIIVFDGVPVTYSTSDLGDISLAYAATVHKSQGSEYPIVVMPIHNTNHIMLERHLVYTGFSRAKKLLVVVGSEAALQYAVRHEVTTKRNTMLKERLRGEVGEELAEA